MRLKTGCTKKGSMTQKGNSAKAIPFFDFMSIGMINSLFV